MNLSLNEELKTKLIEYMSKLEQAVQASGDFVSEQAPLVVQEYVAYIRATETFYVLIGVVLTSLGLVLLNKVFNPKHWPSNQEYPIGIGFLLSSIVSLVAGAGIVNRHTDHCVKSWVAPRILIIDYIRKEVSK